MRGFKLKSYEFRREREASWRQLEALIARVEQRGLSALAPDEIVRLPELYRATLSSLSVSRNISLDKNLVDYLEGLSQRAYFCVYSVRRQLDEAVVAFYLRGFPARVWKMRHHLVLAAALLLAGCLAGLVLTLNEPGRFYSFVDASLAGGRDPMSTRAELREVLTEDAGGAVGTLTTFASFLFSHNTRIGLLCFALGFAAGAPVILLVFTNGLILGAMAAIHVPHRLTLEFWAWILPHGVTELLAVCICAAAGLTVGQALVFPGRHRRIDNLTQQGREAGAVVVGAVILFLIAALIEGLFRQLVQSTWIRLAFALVVAAFWAWYFGRREVRAPDGDHSRRDNAG